MIEWEIALADDSDIWAPGGLTYRETVDELSRAILGRNDERELRARIGRLFSEEFQKLIIVVFEEPTAPATKMRMVSYPSDLFLRLLAAVLANDDNQISLIEHDIRS
jgi:hypothetical protein